MKTLKVVLLALFVTFTLVSFAQRSNKYQPQFKAELVKITTIDKSSDLGQTILKQIDPDNLFKDQKHKKVYIAVVNFNGEKVKIYGSYWQWFRFLKLHYRDWPCVGEGDPPLR